MRKIIILTALFLGYTSLLVRAQIKSSFFMQGQIKNSLGKGIKQAKIDISVIKKTFVADKNGNFSVNIPAGDYFIRIAAPEYKTKDIFIRLKRDTLLDITLESIYGGILLNEVAIEGRKTDKVNATIAGTERLDRATVEKMPALLGEKDPLKALQLLPGVSATTEGGAEMNVRGGGNDQNMLVLDNIPLYSSTHLFGMFSTFNPLTISSTTLYKGDFPAYFGAKLSSVTSLITNDTLAKEFSGIAELGITNAKAALSIPLLHQKSTLYLAGRRSFYDLLFKTFGKGNADIFAFEDYNLNWIYLPNPKNRIKLTLYREQDALGATLSETGYSKGEAAKTQNAFGLNWRYRINPKFVNDATLYYNNFGNILSEEKRNQTLSYLYHFKTSVADVGFKNTFTYSHQGISLFAGTDIIKHRFMPTKFTGDEQGEPFNIENIPYNNATELSLFAGSTLNINNNSKINLGLRNNNYLVAQTSYSSLEPRLSYWQKLTKTSSLKISYARMTQPIHRLTNPGLGFPQDIILSANDYMRPQSANHFSIEFAKDFTFDQEKYSISVQPFYKNLNHIISFKDGFDTRSLMYKSSYRAQTYRDLITIGKSNIYGAEIMLEKKTGKLNGWISYTFLKASDTFAELNNGNSFAPVQDRRHNFNLLANWQVSPKWDIGFSWTFISGQPVNVPQYIFLNVNPEYATGNPNINSDYRLQYLFEQGERGNFRMKPFHKLDVTATYHFKMFGLDATLNLGIYNLYNRKNPSFYYLGKMPGQTQPVLKSVSLFPVIPSTSLKVKF